MKKGKIIIVCMQKSKIGIRPIRNVDKTFQTVDKSCPSVNPNQTTPQGVSPKVWGPILWRIFYDVAWNWDQRNINLSEDDMVSWLKAAGECLPCRFCRESFTPLVASLPMAAAVHKKILLGWMHEVKNTVSRKLREQEVEKFCLDRSMSVQEKENFMIIDSHLHDLPYAALVQRLRSGSLKTTIQERWMVMALFALNFTPGKLASYQIFYGLPLSSISLGFSTREELFLELYKVYDKCYCESLSETEFINMIKNLKEAESGFLAKAIDKKLHPYV